jgi:hypothetical protein
MARRTNPEKMVQLKLRFEEYLRDRLERSARQHKRSMNTEIIVRLNDSLSRDNLNWWTIDLLRDEILKFQAALRRRIDQDRNAIERAEAFLTHRDDGPPPPSEVKSEVTTQRKGKATKEEKQ